MEIPSISASITFLTPQEGGRSQNAYDSSHYRPHIVIGDPNQRVAVVDGTGVATEKYLGVQFTGDNRVLPAGSDHQVTLRLIYFPEVDYSAVISGATFTIREGGAIVGFGRVIRGLPNKPLQPTSGATSDTLE